MNSNRRKEKAGGTEQSHRTTQIGHYNSVSSMQFQPLDNWLGDKPQTSKSSNRQSKINKIVNELSAIVSSSIALKVAEFGNIQSDLVDIEIVVDSEQKSSGKDSSKDILLEIPLSATSSKKLELSSETERETLDLKGKSNNDKKAVFVSEAAKNVKSVSSTSKQYECNMCGKFIAKKNALIIHIKSHETDVKCDVCDKTFRNAKDLKVHMREHITSDFQCEICNKPYNCKYTLRRHVKSHSTVKVVRNRFNLECKVCSRVFHAPNVLALHMKSHRRDKPVHKCDICDLKFVRSYALRQHLAKHVKAPYKKVSCKICSKEFCNTIGLQGHMRSHGKLQIKKPVKTKRYSCSTCCKVYRGKASLMAHQRSHSGVRPFMCHVCGQSFKENGSLNKHSRTHTGIKPYGCKYCDKRFGLSSSLIRHVRIHTGEKPYICDACGKKFATSTYLKSHQRVHEITEDGRLRLYPCSICSKSYRYIDQHMKNHMKDQLYSWSIPQQTNLRHVRNEIVDRTSNSLNAGKIGANSSNVCQSTELFELPQSVIDSVNTSFEGFTAPRPYTEEPLTTGQSINKPLNMNQSKIVKWESSNGRADNANVDQNIKSMKAACLETTKEFYSAQPNRISLDEEESSADFSDTDSVHIRLTDGDKQSEVENDNNENKKVNLENTSSLINDKNMNRIENKSRQKSLNKHESTTAHNELQEYLKTEKTKCKKMNNSVSADSQIDQSESVKIESEGESFSVKLEETERINSDNLSCKSHDETEVNNASEKLNSTIDNSNITTESLFQCDICNKTFKKQKFLNLHLKRHKNAEHGNALNILEDIEDMETSSLRSLLERKPVKANILFEKLKHKCTSCDKAYNSPSKLKVHERVHSGETPFFCDQCGKSFREKSTLRKHSITHTGIKKYHCEYCGKNFGLSSSLTRHVKIHTGEKSFICEVCGYKCSTSCYLTSHISSVHTAAKIFGPRPMSKYVAAPKEQCSICGKLCRELTIHMRLHSNDRQFPCSICEKSFTSAKVLDKHFKTHSGIRPFICCYDDCKRSFMEKSCLRRHELLHNTNYQAFKCDHCPAAFNKSELLENHMRLHFSEKAFKCEICRRPFDKLSRLERHARSHSGDRPYKCDICGKTFSQSGCVKRHIRDIHG